MLIWIILLAIVLIASIAALVRLRARSRERPSAPSDRTPTVGVEMGATIRSYIVPKRWLRDSPGSERPSAESAPLPRYSSATVERLNEAGAKLGTWQLLRGRSRVGRDTDNHVVLDDERVSLHHALITVRDGVYWLEDLGSTNGTFVGDVKRVMTAHPLADGEELRLGGVVLVFRGTPV